jgi:carbon monoxide dehydrogenase subunit G
MFTYEATIFINRPQQEVFDFMSDPANAPKWQNNFVSSEWTSEGPVGVGSTQRAVSRFLGRELETTAEITVWDPPNRTAFKLPEGQIQLEATTTYESKGDGTQITISGVGETGGFFKLAEGLVGNQLQKQLDTNFSALKLLLEAD